MKTLSTVILLCTAIVAQAQTVSFAPTFGTNGSTNITFPLGGEAVAHTLRSDGKFVMAGAGYNWALKNTHVCLTLIDTVCGAQDMTFGSDGVQHAVHQGRTTCHNIAVHPDGKIIGCGMVAPDNSGSLQWPGVFRFNADGSVDSTFNLTGYNSFLFWRRRQLQYSGR